MNIQTGGHLVRCSLRKPAYSLLELTVVLLILSIIIATAQPRYAGALTRYRLDSAADRLIADIQMAQVQSRVTSRSLTIHFQTTGNMASYQFENFANPFQPSPHFSSSDSQTWYTVDLASAPYEVSMTGPNLVTFDGFGNALSSATFALSVGSQSRLVVLDGTTGEVSRQ